MCVERSYLDRRRRIPTAEVSYGRWNGGVLGAAQAGRPSSLSMNFGSWSHLDTAGIRALRTVEKPVPSTWMDRLRSVPLNQQRSVDLCRLSDCYETAGLADENDAQFYAYARHGHRYSPWSVGLGLRRLDNSDDLHLIRLNGAHENLHRNTWPVPRTLPVAPHVHYLTRRGMTEHAHRATGRADGMQYALLTFGFNDIPSALRALARRTNLVVDQLSLWQDDDG